MRRMIFLVFGSSLVFVLVLTFLAAPSSSEEPGNRSNAILERGMAMLGVEMSNQQIRRVMSALVTSGLIDLAGQAVERFPQKQRITALTELALALSQAKHPRAPSTVQAAVDRISSSIAGGSSIGYYGEEVASLFRAGATCDQILAILSSVKGPLYSPSSFWLTELAQSIVVAVPNECGLRVMEKVSPLLLPEVERPTDSSVGDDLGLIASRLAVLYAQVGKTEEALRLAGLVHSICETLGCETDLEVPATWRIAEGLAAKGDSQGACRACGSCKECGYDPALALARAGGINEALQALRGFNSGQDKVLVYLAAAEWLVNNRREKEALPLLAEVASLQSGLDRNGEEDPGTKITREDCGIALFRLYCIAGQPKLASKLRKPEDDSFEQAEAECRSRQSTKDMERFLEGRHSDEPRQLVADALISSYLAQDNPEKALAVANKQSTGAALAVELIEIGAFHVRAGMSVPHGTVPSQK